MLRALIVCHDENLSWALPHLLSRSGFTVDVVTREGVLSQSDLVRSFYIVPNGQSLAAFAAELVTTGSFSRRISCCPKFAIWTYPTQLS
jgi:hypothetical protein